MIARGDATNPPNLGSLLRSVFLLAMVLFSPALPSAPLLGTRLPKVVWSDLLWLVAVMFVAVAAVATGSLRSESFTFLLAFLAYKGGQGLSLSGSGANHEPRVRDVFTIALVIFLAFTIGQAITGRVERVAGPPWFDHPNQFAYVVLVVGFVAATTQHGVLRVALLVGTAAGLILTGSRSGLLAFFLGLAAIAAIDRRWRRPAVAAVVIGAAAVLLASSAFPTSPWAQRILSPAVSILGMERTSKNLLVSTEVLDDATHWNAIGVVADRLAPRPGGTSVWRIARTEPITWARPQQSVTLRGGNDYTLTAALRSPRTLERGALDVSSPGLIGWTAREGSSVAFEVALQGNEAKILRSTGLTIAFASVSDLDDGWRRLQFTFTVAGDGSVPMAIGVSPGISSENLQDVVDVKEIQLETGTTPTTYEPSINRATGTGEALARGEIFDLAWRGVREAPIFGHGRTAFADYYVANGGTGRPASHAHNVVLQVAFQSGVLGVLALIAMLAVLYVRARPPQRALLIGVIVGNLFDSTLTAGTVFYLVAFVMPLRLDGEVRPGGSSRSFTREVGTRQRG